jgi:hypothetical protein
MLGSIKVTFFLLIVLALTVMGSAVSLHTQVHQSQHRNVPNQDLIDRQQKKQAELDSQFPVADYDAAESTTPDETTKRRVKNSRYDRRRFVSKDPAPRVSESARILEGYDVPAIPSAKSDLIVVCDVLGAAAHLSNDKSGIYTELRIKVAEVIKNSSPAQLGQGAEITVEREGGIVRYSNGHRRLYHLAEEGMPRVGRRYVLFLSSVPNSQDNSILTGYELSEAGVVPVDSSRHFAAYRGHAVDAFLDLIRASLNLPQ